MEPKGQRHPPQASAAELRHFALTLAEHQDQLGLRADGVLPSAVPAPEPQTLALAQAIAADLSGPQAAGLAQALGVDVPALQEALQRHEAALAAFREVWSIRTGARRGGELVDRARQVGRALVHAELHSQAAARGDDQRLAEDVADLRQREARALWGRPIEAVATRAFLTQARALLADPPRRRQVQAALTRIPDQRTPDWAALAQAAAALRTGEDPPP